MPKIVVLVKFTPDLTSDRSFLPDGTVDRAGTPGRLSELDEHAAEQALRIQEASAGWELVYLTMGPDGASEALRKLVLSGQSADRLREAAQEAGMRTLRQHGVQRVLEGTTTMEEMLRVVFVAD